MKMFIVPIFTLIFLNYIRCIYPNPNPASFVPASCKTQCSEIGVFGTKIGENNNVPAFSNCKDNCRQDKDLDRIVKFSKEETPFHKEVITGHRWQCVEYSRRWMIVNNNFTFGDVSAAVNIFDLTEETNLKTDEIHNFKSCPNGSESPPEFGDLIIFPIASDAPFGHVGVIVNVNLNDGYIDVAEQNYELKWQDATYSRRLLLLNCDKKEGKKFYTLTDKIYMGNFLKKATFNSSLCLSELKKVIGYKRIGNVKKMTK
jgi:hypothetical protein